MAQVTQLQRERGADSLKLGHDKKPLTTELSRHRGLNG